MGKKRTTSSEAQVCGNPPCAPRAVVVGYASVFNQEDDGGDVVVPGAFASTIKEMEAPLPFYLEHRQDRRLGWVEDIREDKFGLRVIVSLDADPEEIREIDGLSFGYRAKGWSPRRRGRVLEEIELHEVSAVMNPLLDCSRFKIFTEHDAGSKGR